MSDLKTQKTKQSVASFTKTLKNEEQKRDAEQLVKIMRDITGTRPAMWGSSIVGFGTYHYKYKSGKEGDWPITGFSPRKNTLSIYIMPGFKEYNDLLKKLGPHKTGVSCLYIKKLDDIHIPTLKQLIRKSYSRMKKLYTIK